SPAVPTVASCPPDFSPARSVTIPATDRVGPAPAQPGTGLKGRFWQNKLCTGFCPDVPGPFPASQWWRPIPSFDQVTTMTADASFTATTIDYPNGPHDFAAWFDPVAGPKTTLGEFLGVDGASGNVTPSGAGGLFLSTV